MDAKKLFFAAYADAKVGNHAALAPVNDDIQAPQIPNAYLDDTKEVADQKMDHKLAYDTAAAGGLKHMQAEPVASFYIAKTEEVAEAEKQFMEKFTVAETDEPLNIQSSLFDNLYIPDTQDVVDAEDLFITFFDEAKLESMAADVSMDRVAETPHPSFIVVISSLGNATCETKKAYCKMFHATMEVILASAICKNGKVERNDIFWKYDFSPCTQKYAGKSYGR